MKKTCLFAILAALVLGGNVLQAQQPAAATAGPHKVGLIDMAHVFKNYKKFEALRNDLKAEIEKSDGQAKAMAAQIKKTQAEMKNFKEGSPEFAARERELAKLAADFEAFRKVAQRDFLRKEAEIYKTVYLEVSETVKLYAQYKKYTLIMRFNREGVGEKQNPPEVLQSMNKQVVYFEPGNDITNDVLNYLNNKYAGGQAQGNSGTSRN